jgi:hypothetical protein
VIALWLEVALAGPDRRPAIDDEGGFRSAPASLPIRSAPDPEAPVVGSTVADAAFRVFESVDGPGCDAGWVAVEAGGYLCAEGVVPTTRVPELQPELLPFDPPEPDEYDDYVATGTYPHQDPVRIVPQIYGRRWKQFEGRLYADLAAFVRGDPPVGRMTGTTGERLGFVGIEETARGPVLVRDDGRVARLDDVYLYPVSRLEGRDLEADPVAPGQLPAIVVAYGETPVRAAPDEDAAVRSTLSHHQWITVADAPGPWWQLSDGGWVADAAIRQPVPSPGRPDGVGPDEPWIDVVLGPQILTMYRGDDPVYFTVVSTGTREKRTPEGTFRILEKHATRDMRSRPGASDWYEVEDVPWTMVFRSRYALHGAYWHWGFGHTASHGCINLAPLDARNLFERTEPALPPGWQRIVADPGTGTVVRIRD